MVCMKCVGLTQSDVIQIIHHNVGLKCFFHLAKFLLSSSVFAYIRFFWPTLYSVYCASALYQLLCQLNCCALWTGCIVDIGLLNCDPLTFVVCRSRSSRSRSRSTSPTQKLKLVDYWQTGHLVATDDNNIVQVWWWQILTAGAFYMQWRCDMGARSNCPFSKMLACWKICLPVRKTAQKFQIWVCKSPTGWNSDAKLNFWSQDLLCPKFVAICQKIATSPVPRCL